jgi:YidC/Oxa1 family membrane protein insertase
MDRNSIIGLVLIGILIIGYSIYTRPTQEEIDKYRKQQDSVASLEKTVSKDPVAATVKDTTVSPVSDSLLREQAKAQFGTFATSASGKEELYTMENELIKVTISTKGGKIVNVQLKEYKTFDGKPLNLFRETPAMGLSFIAGNRNISTNELFFQPAGSSANVSGNDSSTLKMRVPAGDGNYVEYIYTLKGNRYDLGFTINAVGLNNLIPLGTDYINLNWKTIIPRQEKNITAERTSTTIYYRFQDGEVDYLSETSDEKESLPTKVQWVAFKQQYFTSVLIANQGFEKPTAIETLTDQESSTDVRALSANFTIPYTHKPNESFGMRFYFGPNHYQTLKKYDLDLEKQIPLGWGIFGWVNRFIVIPIFNFLDSFGLNYGLIIFILTIVIKLMLLPLTYKAYLSQAKMKVLKPEIDEIQARKGDDPMKTQQELMALYRKGGVNPFGGCLPLLLQLPILIAMFRFFPASIELRQKSFLWADDLSTYDSILDFGFNIPGYGDHISLFTLLMTISTIIYTRMNNQFTGANAQMKWISYLMPIVFLGVFNNYSAALSYYYFLANILTFGQQYLFGRFVDEEAIHKQIQENKKKPLSATKSKFQQRMEEMAKARAQKPKKK